MRKSLAFAAATAAAAALLAACSSGGGGSSATPSATGAETTSAGGSGDAVTLTMWSWDPNMEDIVKVWNAANPDIQVKLSNPAGGDKLVSRILTAHKSGEAADIVKVEYQALPALVANGIAADLSPYLDKPADKYSPGAFSQVNFEGKVYGLPQDFAPLVAFFRKDILDAHNIAVPTTWEEYAQAARTLHAADPKVWLGNFSSSDPGQFAGLAQQAGANWWSAKGDAWTVSINDDASKTVADYWGGLVKEGAIKGDPNWTPQWNKEMDDGTIAGWISGAWAPAQLPAIAANTAGKWTMVPLPAWTAGDKTTGIWGGSATAVTTDSKHPEQAAKFIDWFNGSDEGVALQVEKINIFPASISGQKLPALATPPAFMSNQPSYYADVAAIAADARSFDIWGPNATVTFGAFNDGFAKAVTDGTSFSDVLTTMQDATVADMKKLGFTVTE